MQESEKKPPTVPADQNLKGQTQSSVSFNTWQLAGELGYTIAIPIVLLALLGRWVDKQLDSSPWLLLAGIIVSILVSSALVYRKVKKLLE